MYIAFLISPQFHCALGAALMRGEGRSQTDPSLGVDVDSPATDAASVLQEADSMRSEGTQGMWINHRGHTVSSEASEDQSSKNSASTVQACHNVDCQWTLDWNCPGQPNGRIGKAGDDGTVGYSCCCKDGGWRQNAGTYSTVVIVRTHDPMPGMLERMKAWADDLHQNMPSVLFAISIDTTGGFQNTVSQIKTAMPDTLVHTYSWQDIVAAYPRISEIADGSCIKQGFRGIKHNMFSAYGFHTEAIVMATDFLRSSVPGLAWNADTKVWVLEDDIFFCGSQPTLTNFLGQYASDDKDDLITAKFLGKIAPNTCNVHCHSPAFGKRYSVHTTYISYEFVTRWSSPLLTHIKSLLDEGIHGQSEKYGSTVCINDNFHFAGIRSEFIGKAFEWNSNENRSEAAKICSHDSGITTVNHAGKYF